MEIWLEGALVAQLAEVTPQMIRKAIASGAWRGQRLIVRQVNGNAGSPRYQILLSSLPQDLQTRYYESQLPRIQRPLANRAPDDPTVDFHMLPGPRTDRDKLKAKCISAYLDNPSRRTAEGLAAQHGIHWSAIYRWVKQAEDRAQKSAPMITVADQPIILKLPHTAVPEGAFLGAIKWLLDNPRMTLQQGYERLRQQDIDISYAQFTRLVSGITPSFADLRLMLQGGNVPLYLERTPKIIRAWLQLPAGHTLVGDQHLLDWAAVDPHSGEVVLMQLYLWVDCTSRYWMGLAAAFGPYSKYTVGLSLLDACTLHIPNRLYNDWGRPENSVYIQELSEKLSGMIDWGNWRDFREVYPDAGISRKHSTPGVPPVKPIESQMNVLTTYLKQEGLTGYRKRDMSNPFINKQTGQELADAKKDGSLPTVPELLETLAKVVARHNLNVCRTEEGPDIVPAEVLWRGLAGRRRVIPEQDLKLLFYPRTERKVRNATITLTQGGRKLQFTAPELALVPPKETVAIQWNPLPPHDDGLVYRRKGDDWEPYCRVSPWNYHGINPDNAEALSEAMRIKQGYLKRFREALKDIHARAQEHAGVADSTKVVQITTASQLRQAHATLEAPQPSRIDRQKALEKLADRVLGD